MYMFRGDERSRTMCLYLGFTKSLSLRDQGCFLVILVVSFLSTIPIRPQKIYMCFKFPDPKHFTVNFEENIVEYAEKWGVV